MKQNASDIGIYFGCGGLVILALTSVGYLIAAIRKESFASWHEVMLFMPMRIFLTGVISAVATGIIVIPFRALSAYYKKQGKENLGRRIEFIINKLSWLIFFVAAFFAFKALG